MKKVVLPSIIALVALSFGYLAYALFFVALEPFPNLAEGKYLGYFSGEIVEAGSNNVYFSVESLEASPNIKFILYRAGWGLENPETQSSPDQESQPLVLTGPQGVLRFSGRAVSSEYAEGMVVNVSNGKESKWELFYSAPKLDKKESNIDLAQVLSIRAEQDNLEMQIRQLKKSIEEVGAEQIRISEIIADRASLQQKAQNRFTAKQSEIDRLKLEIAEEEKRFIERQAALEVARSVTQRGQLTSMARESLAREFRAINYKLSAESRQNDIALMAEFARAQEALALQDELSANRDPDSQEHEEPVN